MGKSRRYERNLLVVAVERIHLIALLYLCYIDVMLWTRYCCCVLLYFRRIIKHTDRETKRVSSHESVRVQTKIANKLKSNSKLIDVKRQIKN